MTTTTRKPLAKNIDTLTIGTLNPEQAALTGEQTLDGFINWMTDMGCFQGPDQRLGYWPNFILWATVNELVNAGLLTRKHYGPATYGHTDYFLVMK